MTEIVPSIGGRELLPSAAMSRRALRLARPGVEEAIAEGVVASAHVTAASWVAAEAVLALTCDDLSLALQVI